MLTMPQSRNKELKKASKTDADQNYTQIGFDRDFPTSVHKGGCFMQLTISRTVVASRRSFGGAMFASTGSHFTVPEMNRIVLFSCKSILLMCTLFNHTKTQYSALK
jgi:hypothetical protein